MKKKIAVLGGGVGSMSAVWALTSLNDWQNSYDITVYQLGWRLGGKGASGRDMTNGARIEEHGLHVWAGFYANAFRVMRELFDEWEMPADCPFQSWTDAFKPQSGVIVDEFVRGEWVPWYIDWPPGYGTPGDEEHDVPANIWGYIVKLIEWVVNLLEQPSIYTTMTHDEHKSLKLWKSLTGGDDHPEITPDATEGRGLPESLDHFGIPTLLKTASKFAKWLKKDAAQHLKADHLALVAMFATSVHRLERDFGGEFDINDDLRRLYCTLDMATGTIKGLLADEVFLKGWDSIDDWEWRDWMKHHGVSDYTLKSVAVRGLYDYIFAFPNGDFDYPSVGAGTAIHGAFRLVFTYRGSMFYYMQAGMGDTIFTPFYEVLKARGVKFNYFHRVENLGLDTTKTKIDTIRIRRQVTLKSGNPEDYDPMVNVKGLPCWPSYPNWDQIVEGEQLKEDSVNLESHWSSWEGVESFELQAGEDFDQVILGIPHTTFPDICPELIEANEAFAKMTKCVSSCSTQAVQMWFDVDAETLGAPIRPVVSTAFADPINTWADMTHLIKQEEWGDKEPPKYLAYFCGPMTDAEPIAPYSDHEFPQREYERVQQTGISWMKKYAQYIWHECDVTKDGEVDFRWELLHAEGEGVERMKEQYFRANIDPNERYILSTPNTTHLRLKAGETGFDRLVVAGDWTYTSISAGCVEAAAMSGLHAAEVISGVRFKIVDRGY